MIAVVVAEFGAIILLGLLVAGLLRSHAEILRRLHELGAGLDDSDHDAAPQPLTLSGRLVDVGAEAAAYDVAGERLDGASVSLSVRGARHDTFLAFLSSSCSTCRPFWDAFADTPSVPGGARLVVVVEDDDNVGRLRRLAPDDVTVVRSTSAWEEYGVPGWPHFVYVDGPTGRVVGEGTGQTWDRVRDLIEHAIGGREVMPDPRDNAERIDRELAAAGIGPGHPSLYAPVDDGTS